MADNHTPFNGLLNVYKEAGFTSNDVVAKLRGILRQKKIGHTGTLDPAAVGVLPILLGSACRLSEYLTDHDKTYRAIVRLGVETDTQDMTGKILSRADQDRLSSLDPEKVREAATSFQGGYDQIPPMYSAKQIGGKRLYDLAREGKVVERKPVHVDIPSIKVESIDLPLVTMTVECSKGTYIRTLCADIGHKLGVGGAMESLVRLRVGDFHIEDSIPLSRVEELAHCGQIGPYIIPCEEVFLDCLRVWTTEEADRKLYNGNELTMAELGLPMRGGGEMIRVCDSFGNFIAVYRFAEKAGTYRPYRMLADKPAGS